MDRSLKRLSLLFVCLLPLAVSQAPGCVPPCDTHMNNVPAGIGWEHDMIHNCIAGNAMIWHQASDDPDELGDVVLELSANTIVAQTCGEPVSQGANEALCTTRCEQIAAHLGAVDADCSVVWAQLATDTQGLCDFTMGCSPEDFPPPGPGLTADPEPTVFCQADPNAEMNLNLDWNPPAGDDFDACPGCLRYAYTAEASDVYTAVNVPTAGSCGYQAVVHQGQTPAQACNEACTALLVQQIQTDYPTLEDNCSTFIVTPDPACASGVGAMPPFRENVVWETPNGPVVEPMACDDCCSRFGPGACDRLQGQDALSLPAAHQSARVAAGIHLPDGTSRRGDIDVEIAYLMDAAGQGTSPLYVDGLTLDWKPAAPVAMPSSAGGPRQWLYRVTAQLHRPVLSAYRTATAAFQVLPGTATVDVRAMIGATAATAKPVTTRIVPSVPLRGWLVPGRSLQLEGELEIAPGARVTF